MRPWDAYWDRVRLRAAELKSDGCTGVIQLFFYEACGEHDIHYREHTDLDGKPITRPEADIRFLHAMWEWSWFGRFSVLAWIFYIGVRLFGGRAWEKGALHDSDDA